MVCVSDVSSFEIVCLIFEMGGGVEGEGEVNSAVLSPKRKSLCANFFPHSRTFNIPLFSACLIVLGFSQKQNFGKYISFCRLL